MDCSAGFVPTVEEALYKDLSEKASIEFIDLEEPKREPEEKEKEKENAEKGTKGMKKKGKEGATLATQASQANVSTHSSAKAAVEVFAATTATGSPYVAPPLPAPAPSQSEGNLPNVALHKRKIVALDGSVTSLESYSESTLIENVDMTKLIEIHTATKIHHPTYTHIQEFLAKVCPYTLLSLVYLVCIQFTCG